MLQMMVLQITSRSIQFQAPVLTLIYSRHFGLFHIFFSQITKNSDTSTLSANQQLTQLSPAYQEHAFMHSVEELIF